MNHKGQRYRRSFTTEQQADAWALESKAKLIRGEPIDMGENAQAKRKGNLPYTLDELVQHVYDTHWAPMPGGQKALINARSIIGIIGASLPVHKLGKADIDKARAKLLTDGNSPGTVNRKVAALSKALSEAEDLGLIDHKPKLTRYKESEHRVRRFTPEEERLALAYFDRIGNQDMADYLVLSLDTGMRQGEVLSLHFGDAQEGRVTVWGVGAGTQRTKSGKSRTVPLTRRAQAVLDRRKETAKGKEVFPSLNKNQVSHYWGRMAEALGLEADKQFVPHILRHEFCSKLAANGENAVVIQKLAGHSTLAVTQRYVHLFGGELDGAIERLEKAEGSIRGTRADLIITDEIDALSKALASLPAAELDALLATIRK
ncbi:tyrosine-type recombinase/integrase [Neorhizobium galegae]|uniref:tyrosine-type recombinase/integrase n=1 Tax=Neorhizobium galegae TaxID=399 RepID=UPI002107A9BA|nr:site-specific integrase [Neorhizobium galegae]